MPPFVDALQQLQRRHRRAQVLAGEAAGSSIRPNTPSCARLADEARLEYQEMVTSLRELRDANPPVRFITSFALDRRPMRHRARHG